MRNISIIIPVYNEERYIEACLDSILQSNYARDKMEVLLVDGMSSDRTKQIIMAFQAKYPFIKHLENKKQIAPVAMNIGIQHAVGDCIFIISAHASYPINYFKVLSEQLYRLNADCVGGVLYTDIKNKNKKSSAIKQVLSSKVGVGNAIFRTGIDKVIEVDTVAFGCYKKEVFEKYGYYDERLVRNQDIELNKRIINGGGKIYLVPDVKCTYYARENFRDLAKNNFANGKWNILTAYYTGTLRSLSLRHFVPLGFVLSLIVPFLLGVWDGRFAYLSLFVALSYLLLVIIVSLKLKNSENGLFYLVGGFVTLHLAYGIGSLAGIFAVIRNYIKGDR